MREIRPSGSEGGVSNPIGPPYPYQALAIPGFSRDRNTLREFTRGACGGGPDPGRSLSSGRAKEAGQESSRKGGATILRPSRRALRALLRMRISL